MVLMQALPVVSMKAASTFSLIHSCFGLLQFCTSLAGLGTAGLEEESVQPSIGACFFHY
jgi:hypothetical protein